MPVTQNIAPLTISFSNTSQGESLTYLWNFGDGTTSAEANPTSQISAKLLIITDNYSRLAEDNFLLSLTSVNFSFSTNTL